MEAKHTVEINEARWKEIQARSLKRGGHAADQDEMCVMEAVAYVAGEPWTDHPECTCPVITSFMVSWNDSLQIDDDRDRLLKPLVPLLVGTRSTKEIEEKRGYLALDWLIRVHTPKWLDLVPALHEQAKQLRELEPILDMAGAAAAGVKVNAARDAAWSAALAGAEAGRAGARAGAGSAAGDAACDAALAGAGDAAWSAALAGAEAAGRAGAGSAAGDALRPTTEWLQTSAIDLVKRMIALAKAGS